MKWLKSFLSGFTMPLLSNASSAHTANNFSPHAQQALFLARREADRLNHNFVGTEHLLLGIVSLGQGVAVKVLLRLGLGLEGIKAEVEKHIGRGPDEKISSTIPYTPRVKNVLALAAKAARSLNHTYVGTEHILLGLLEEGDGVAARVLEHFDIHLERTRQEILKILDPNAASVSEAPVMEWTEVSTQQSSQAVDVTKRYDIYCHEQDRQVVYRNALLKGVKTLFKTREFDALAEFMEVEQADGRTVLVPRHSIIKLCEHGVNPTPDVVLDKPSKPETAQS